MGVCISQIQRPYDLLNLSEKYYSTFQALDYCQLRDEVRRKELKLDSPGLLYIVPYSSYFGSLASSEISEIQSYPRSGREWTELEHGPLSASVLVP